MICAIANCLLVTLSLFKHDNFTCGFYRLYEKSVKALKIQHAGFNYFTCKSNISKYRTKQKYFLKYDVELFYCEAIQ